MIPVSLGDWHHSKTISRSEDNGPEGGSAVCKNEDSGPNLSSLAIVQESEKQGRCGVMAELSLIFSDQRESQPNVGQ